MTAGGVLIRLSGAGVSLGGRRILHDIDLAVHRAEIVTVLGPNGSGKTTLMRAILGTVAVSSGRVWRAAGLRIAYVPQRLSVDALLPITAARFMNLPCRRSPALIARALDRAGLGAAGGRPLSGLSGGQMQRLLLARALLGRPDLLILDEGAAGLDQAGIAAYYARVAEVRAETGCAVLMVSHDLQVVMRASDRVVCLNGHVCCAGTPEAVSLSPAYLALSGGAEGAALGLYRHRHDHTHEADGACAADAGASGC